jgi:hypothetical protein
LTVDIGEPKDVVQDFMDKEGLTFPTVLDETGAVAKEYQLLGHPTSFFIDREGLIRNRHTGPMNESIYAEVLGELLAGESEGFEALSLAPISLLSDMIRGAPSAVRDAYRFAIANPDILSNIPCYCGCRDVGHQSNLDCFVKQFNADGSVALDNHAFG